MNLPVLKSEMSISRIFGKSRVKMCNVRNCFLTMAENSYERCTFPHDLSRIFRKSREEMCNFGKFFLTMGTRDSLTK